MNDTFWGILLGGAITTGFTWFLDYLKSKREENTHFRERKEDAYFKMLNFYSSFITRTLVGVGSADLIHIAEENKGLLLTYGSKEVVKQFYVMEQTMNDFIQGNADSVLVNQTLDNLINSIRKELGIKD